jgi:Immunoglobulin I-set domain
LNAKGKSLVFFAVFAALCVVLVSCAGSSGSKAGAVAPSIATQPASQSVSVGQTAMFAVTATGTEPLSFQWRKGGQAIMGATSSSYTTPPTTMADNNSSFDVIVSNSAGQVTSSAATLTVTSAPDKPLITTQPASISVNLGATATFTVVATGTGLTYQWQKGTGNISGATSASYTTPATTAADNNSTFRVVVSNSAGSVTSSSATLTVVSGSPSGTAMVLTYHNDNARTGLNAGETILTTANVNSTSFGRLGSMPVDGLVDAQPLYVSSLTIAGAPHNVVFVATEHDSVYAFDADTFAQLWKVTVLGSGETTSDTRSCSQVFPEIGITSTPVIDMKAGAHGTIFVVAMSKNGSSYFQRLHALDLTTGAEQPGSPTNIEASFTKPVNGGQTTFDPKQYKERSALLLLNGVIYTTWASHCDIMPYQGWLMGYSESTLQQTSVLNITPNGGLGAFWGAGAGPAADSSGNFYVLAGNGTFDSTVNGGGFPTSGDFGNGFLKIAASASSMTVADYFMMFDTTSESNGDVDLGSGGPLVLPDLKDNIGNTWHLAVGAGKDGRIYVVNRDLMGKFNTSNDHAIYQELDGALPGGVFSTSAYFNNTVYYGPVGSNLRAFSISNAKLSTSPSSQSAGTFGYPGSTPSVSSNANANGIVWAIQNGSTGVLHAYDASNLAKELYNSDQAGSRDQFTTDSHCKFVTPTIANGKVFVGTNTAVVVFGLRNP